MKLTDTQWKEKLTPEQYHILREKGTEAPFSGKYADFDEEGIYRCAGCAAELFSSNTKYDAGCGWPSFTSPDGDSAVVYLEDTSLGMKRTEVQCRNCGGHLGHVFNDGPSDSGGKRFCINAGSLSFKEKEA